MAVFYWFLILLFSSSVTCETCGISEQYRNTVRVVGGQRAAKMEYPWIVTIQQMKSMQWIHVCGGSIISLKYVLTAAHCFISIANTKYKVVAGKYCLHTVNNNEQEREVKSVISNYFDFKTISRDISVLELKDPFIYSRAVRPICVPNGTEHFLDVAVVSGWGFTAENGKPTNVLNKVKLHIIDNDYCKTLYLKQQVNYVDETKLCTLDEDKDACTGDSGGPLMCLNVVDLKMYVCGIVSWGLGCARPNTPGLYTKVSVYYNWIQKVQKINNNQ